MLQVVFDLFAMGLQIIIAIIFTGKIIKIGQKLDRGHSAGKLTGHGEYKVNKAAAKGLQMFRSLRLAPQFRQTVA